MDASTGCFRESNPPTKGSQDRLYSRRHGRIPRKRFLSGTAIFHICLSRDGTIPNRFGNVRSAVFPITSAPPPALVRADHFSRTTGPLLSNQGAVYRKRRGQRKEGPKKNLRIVGRDKRKMGNKKDRQSRDDSKNSRVRRIPGWFPSAIRRKPHE